MKRFNKKIINKKQKRKSSDDSLQTDFCKNKSEQFSHIMRNGIEFMETDTAYPPLFTKKPWTSKVFHRDYIENTTTNEDGSKHVLSYSYIPPAKKPRKKSYGPIDENGELQYPKKKSKEQMEIERIAKEKQEKRKKEEEMKGFVLLEDLLSGEYFRRKENEKRLKNERLLKFKQKQNELKLKRQADELKNLAKLQASLPVSPEEQLKTILKIVYDECLSKDDDTDKKIIYYINSKTLHDYIAPYPIQFYERAHKKLSIECKKNFKNANIKIVIENLEHDILKGFIEAMKETTLRHVLKDPFERQRLGIAKMAQNWPAINIRAPMAWHTPMVIAKQKLSYAFFQGNNIILELKKLWNEKYDKMLICDMVDLKEELTFPIYCNEFEEHLNKRCQNARSILLNEWLCDVADIMVRLRGDWKCYAPKKKSDKTFRVEGFLRTVRAVMSIQLRSLVLRSLEHFSNEFANYMDGNDYDGEYQDFVLNKNPLLLVKIDSNPDTGELCFVPPLIDIRSYVRDWLLTIISINIDIPRVETYLFPEFADRKIFLLAVNESEEYVKEIINNTLNYFNCNCTGPNKYLNIYKQFDFILDGSAKRDLMDMYKKELFPLLKEFSLQIREYESLKKNILFLRRHIPLNLLMIDCTVINDNMFQIVSELRQHIVEYFVDLNRQQNKMICQVYQNMSQRSSEMPETTAELVELINYIIDCRDVTIYDLKDKSRITAENVLFLMDHAVLSAEDITLNSRVFVWPSDMETIIDLALKTLTTKRNMAEEALKGRRSIFDEKLKRHERLLDAFRKLDPPMINMDIMKDYVIRVDEIYNKLQEYKQEAMNINEEETLLEQDVSNFVMLTAMLASVEPFHQLWHTSLDFHVGYEKWYYGPFKNLNAEEIKDIVEEQWKLLRKLSKQLFDYPGAKSAAYMVRARVDKFKLLIPILRAICNEGLQPHHWEMISDLIGKPIELRPDLSLADMIELGIQTDVEKLEEISVGASKEYALQKSLKKMKEDWIGVKFECVLYRETGVAILSAVDDIQLLLDDHILKSQTMRGSPYIKPFEAEMQAWEEKLISMQDILDQWLQVQNVWMYLEPIFSSEDIMRQMPIEARNFKEVDREWRTIMGATVKNPDVLESTDYPGLLNSLRSSNNFLLDIQRGLNDYLEKKRLFFPRFFFLSNDELLEILSETKDPTRVQPHLKKCFEGIDDLEFNDQEEITGFKSSENEIVSIANVINPEEAKGMVERWLSQLEEQMCVSLKNISIESTAGYFSTKRTDWIMKWPGQIVQVVNCIQFTTEVTDAIENNSLKDHLEKCNLQINDLGHLMQEHLEPSLRITIEALIVIDVHGRDIVKLMLNLNISKTTDFNWISQLRYYWKDNVIICSMVTVDIDYGFEYLGNTGRLVATPLTDRCFRTLMSAFKLNLGGAPEGPAGTGKTETCKDLAKAVAKKCVVFNCSDSLDYKALGKFFKGLAQSGAWACFDEFNRIELEVLSVVAQQILSIQMAVIRKAKRFNFEGTEISLNLTCTIFITMNPGYAGRQELPDNLKVLFRTVAMMVPDYALIGEITLYSNGFENSGPLAEKIVQTYKLCSEQLSSKKHYDYGMRAVKSVLIAAGSLKKKYPEQNESEIVLRAIIDINLPKFSTEDAFLFTGIYQDLFPGVEVPEPERNELKKHILNKLEENNLEATPWVMEKIMQTYEMILIRHGLMLVGDAMSGKTTVYKILSEALYSLQTQKPPANHKEFGAIYSVINPKSITMGQLYGFLDEASNEWNDGVLAIAFRKYAVSKTKERKWIIFDGPVDAIWIESLNTVLDDNKKLCLTSGEIIQMTRTMNLIFEPADLNHASPATVSRCGMIYFEAKGLGWEPLYQSFIRDIKDKVTPEHHSLIQELIDWLMPSLLKFLKKSCVCFVETNEQHLFFSFRRLFLNIIESENQPSTVWLQCILVFSIVWALSCTANGDSKKMIDGFYRKLLDGGFEENPKPKSFKLTKNQLFPEKGSIFDYTYDKKNGGTWINWTDIERDSTNAPNPKISDLFIHTNESTYINYFVQRLLVKNIPVMIIGPTGTGKSCVAKNYLFSLPRNKFITNTINFSAQTTANQTQEIIMSKLDKRRKGVFGPAMGKQCILFIDDLSMPQKEVYDAQPPLELLRQWIDHGHWYDLKSATKQELVDVRILAATLPPGGGSNKICSRLIRHFHIVCVDLFEDVTLQKIFGAIMDWNFSRGFTDTIVNYSKNVITATLEVYKQSKMCFLPTPSKSHYTFNLRDFSKVIKGILLVPSTHMKTTEKLITLWVHEVYRVFFDRLVDDNDRTTLFNIINASVSKNFRTQLSTIISDYISKDEKINFHHVENIFFGNYMEPDADPKIYDQVMDQELMIEKMDYYLKEYNLTNSPPMQMIMFKYALDHISRACRVLLQNDGHLLMVGMSGSGRTSAVKLASSILEMNCFQIHISSSYGKNEWREDVKKLLKKSGISGKPMVFLFSDSQVKGESMVEDLNMIINAGDIPNLYVQEDKIEIGESMLAAARDSGQSDTSPFGLFNLFIDRVKANLHIAFAMSPIGDSFRNRLRMFPSLVNCCTIDWYTTWPPEALEKVAHMYLTDMNIGTEEIVSSCIKTCKLFHTSVEEFSQRFKKEQKRINYVTPTSYLELIKMFNVLYFMKVDQITLARNRYISGLEQLDFAAGQITDMKTQLTNLHPQLVDTSAATEKLMIKIEQDTVVVEAQKEIVGADEASANEAAAAAQAIKDDCEGDLAEAVPALESAVSALNTLKPADITLVKSMKNPPSGVKLVMEAICVMKGVKSDRKANAEGFIVEDYWGPSLKLLGDMKFLESLKTYDKDNINPSTMKRIREKYIPDRDFNPAVITKVSTACEGLCKWVRAMEVYDRVIKVVAPKKLALAEAEAELQAQMFTLNQKRAELQSVLDKLQTLNDEFAEYTRKKKGLEDKISVCSKKLERAEKLIGGLSGEKSRWSQLANDLQNLLDNIIGDVLLAAGFIAYLGAFTTNYRNELVSLWNQECLNYGIACSQNFSLISTLGEQVLIRDWNIAGLPADNYSVENGIIINKSRRWSLMIDPQDQAGRWLKTLEKVNNIISIKFTDANYLNILEKAMGSGTPVILENVQETLDAILDPLLELKFIKSGKQKCIQLTANLIELHPNFRFYITTKLRNPHFLPDASVKVTLVNFMITPRGLQDQLLGIVVARDKPDLEKRKNELIVEGANNKKMLKEIEDQILEVLSTEGNILEDEQANSILSSSKALSEEIQEKQMVALITEKEIDDARSLYIPVSKHSANLFFSISELVNINPMYQYSLSWFITLYDLSIVNAAFSDALEERIKSLNNYFTVCIYENICQSLFEKDKLVFSFILTIGILRSEGKINDDLLTFLLRGGISLDNPYENPANEWFPDKQWFEIVKASTINGLTEFRTSFTTNIDQWKLCYDHFDSDNIVFPSPFDRATEFIKLILIRCIRPDKLVPAIRQYIIDNMGKKYIEPPPFNLEESYSNSNCGTPLIFILSSGSDPMSALTKFAAEKNDVGLKSISLGQGQGPLAKAMIDEAILNGGWVVLQNCHLMPSWMTELEKICCEKLTAPTIHKDFRCWLTSYPSVDFPVSILQNGVKMINESPSGFRNNLLRSYTSDPISDDDFYTSCSNENSWRRLLFSLCCFHALVQERKKFGPLGWNIPYEFNDSDLSISIMQLKMFLNDYEDIPFEAITYLTGECNYGGRVTDDKDRRLLLTLLSTFYNKDIVEEQEYAFSPSGIYKIPENLDKISIIEYIKQLPSLQHPEIFGLHENADITKDNYETTLLLSRALETQTHILVQQASKESGNDLADLINEIVERLPEEFNVDKVAEKYPTLYANSMNTVLKQEVIRFNGLLLTIKESLKTLKLALEGFAIMSTDLENCLYSISKGVIPEMWKSKSYPSLKPLGSYISDLLLRLKFFENWIENGPPATYWFSGFFFTQSFLTGVLQNYSRKYKISIDLLCFEFEVTQFETEAGDEAEFGVYSKGLFLEGARWNREMRMLDECHPKILYDPLPIVWTKPAKRDQVDFSSSYMCPVYKTSERRGVLATTGHSSNFVMNINLKTDKPEKHWIGRGVACLTQLDD